MINVPSHRFTQPQTLVDNEVLRAAWCWPHRQRQNSEAPPAIEGALYGGFGTHRGQPAGPETSRGRIAHNLGARALAGGMED